MIYKIKYDRSNINWMDDDVFNIMFLRQQKNYHDQICKSRGFVTLSEVLESLGVDPFPIWTTFYGWSWIHGRDSVDWEVKAPILFHPGAYYELIFHVDPCFDCTTAIPRRSGKTLCAEAIKHVFEEYGLENRKENNMASKSDIPCILIGKKGDPRGVHTVELKIKNVIFNNPATIVFWSDGTKTVVKAGANDIFDPEKGLAMAISKKMLGNNYKAYGRFKKWLPKEYNNAAFKK